MTHGDIPAPRSLSLSCLPKMGKGLQQTFLLKRCTSGQSTLHQSDERGNYRRAGVVTHS